MWSQLLQKHHLSKKPFDPTFIGPKERYEIKESRHFPPQAPPRPRREESHSQFVLKSRKEKEKTIRKSFSAFLQLVLFLQFVILLPLLTAAFLFKFGSSWSEENFLKSNCNIGNATTISTTCQFIDAMGQIFESNTTYNCEVIKGFVNGIGNCLIGFLFMILFATMLTLVYVRTNNIFPMIGLVAVWTLFALNVDEGWFWKNFAYYFGFDDSIWTTDIQEITTTNPPPSSTSSSNEEFAQFLSFE